MSRINNDSLGAKANFFRQVITPFLAPAFIDCKYCKYTLNFNMKLVRGKIFKRFPFLKN